MPLDPVLVADTMDWLWKAAGDLRAADVDIAASPPLVEDALFHCQQAVEKSFKAFLTYHKQPFRRTHDLEETGEACLVIDPTLRTTVDETVPLSEYAWAYRYPGPHQAPSVQDALIARDAAGRAYQAILARLPAETRP